MKDLEESKKENRRDWIKKDTKSQNQHSKSNQIIQSVEESAYNKSVFETKKSEYGGTKSE